MRMCKNAFFKSKEIICCDDRMKINGMEIEAAIFDLDGTIADSMGVWYRIDVDFFSNRGMDIPEGYKDAISSMDFSRAASYTKRRFNLTETENEIIAEWNELARYEYALNIPLKEGAFEFLTALDEVGVKIGLATASGRELYEPLLKRNGVFELFSSCVTTVQAGKDKNSPDVYLLCAKELGCKPEKCMIFEDILPGVLSAKSVGMKAAGVYDPCSAHEREKIIAAADLFIEDFKDAIKLIKAI